MPRRSCKYLWCALAALLAAQVAQAGIQSVHAPAYPAPSLQPNVRSPCAARPFPDLRLDQRCKQRSDHKTHIFIR